MNNIQSSTQTFFAASATAEPEQRPRIQGPIDINDRTICRWCLRKFDIERALPRQIRERGQLRTNLKMSDNGSELVICDDCWPGAYGYLSVTMGQLIPTPDPNVIPNPLLRRAAEFNNPGEAI